MKRENKENLTALIKIKKLTISEMTKAKESLKENGKILDLYLTLIRNNEIEIKILTYISKSEEKSNGTR